MIPRMVPEWLEVEVSSQIPENVTLEDEWPAWKVRMQLAYDIIVVAILQMIMLGMGCNITFTAVLKHLRRPWPILVGAFCQFVLMPLSMFGFAHALNLPAGNAIGMMTIASCPGGGLSNLFTYNFDGDVPLSISMTALSTLLALGMMPLNLFIYARSWTSDSAVIPFLSIFISLVTIIAVVSLGILIHWKWPRVAAVLVKVGAGAGVLFCFVAIGMQGIIQPGSYLDSVWTVWIAAMISPVVGFILGFIVATIGRLDMSLRKTLGFETGVQNMALASTIITTSYGDLADEALIIPTLFAFFMIVIGFCASLIFILYKRHQKKKEKENEEKEAKDTSDGNANHDVTVEKVPDQWNSSFILIEKF